MSGQRPKANMVMGNSNRSRFLHRAWLTAVALMLAAAPVSAEKSDDEKAKDTEVEVDHLGLAARLLHDEHYDRALQVLSEVDPNDPTVDAARFYTLRGLAHLQQKHYAEARRDFGQAAKAGQKDPSLHLYEAQACFMLEDFKCALDALKKSGRQANDKEATLLMKSEAEWRLGRRESALSTLASGERRFPEQAEFQRLQIFYLIDMGLYLSAVDVSERYLARKNIEADEYVAIAEALRSANAFRRAQLLMEGARLRYPEDENVLVQLAHCYLDAGRQIPAAMLFEEAARINPKFTLEAAELYKEAGMLHRAEWLNARVVDQKAKTKQRLSLLVESQDFEAVTAMLPKLSRLGLLADENIRYAVAYAHYKTGQFDAAEEQLKPIRDPQLFESALQLRKAMAACREAGWECSP